MAQKCPEPESNQWHEDFQSSALPTELSGHVLLHKNSGDRIWTCDLRVMSPTSFQTAPPRVIKTIILFCHFFYTSKRRLDGGGFEPPKQFAADLQSVPFGHSGIHPYGYYHKPIEGLEPPTCWLQISCSANWAISAKHLLSNWFVISLLCLQLTHFIPQLSWIKPYRRNKLFY